MERKAAVSRMGENAGKSIRDCCETVRAHPTVIIRIFLNLVSDPVPCTHTSGYSRGSVARGGGVYGERQSIPRREQRSRGSYQRPINPLPSGWRGKGDSLIAPDTQAQISQPWDLPRNRSIICPIGREGSCGAIIYSRLGEKVFCARCQPDATGQSYKPRAGTRKTT